MKTKLKICTVRIIYSFLLLSVLFKIKFEIVNNKISLEMNKISTVSYDAKKNIKKKIKIKTNKNPSNIHTCSHFLFTELAPYGVRVNAVK